MRAFWQRWRAQTGAGWLRRRWVPGAAVAVTALWGVVEVTLGDPVLAAVAAGLFGVAVWDFVRPGHDNRRR